MKKLPSMSSSALTTFISADSLWISSTKDCLSFGRHFKCNPSVYFFAIPYLNQMRCDTCIQYASIFFVLQGTQLAAINSCVQIANHQQILVSLGTDSVPYRNFVEYNAADSQDQKEEFLIYLNGWFESTIAVYTLDPVHNGLMECAHSIVPPEKPLVLATGGVLKGQTNTDTAVVCGGEFIIEDSNDNIANDRCTILKSVTSSSNIEALSSSGLLNIERIGASSLVLDNGKTLWVTGGTDAQSNTEFVTIHNGREYWTNAVGPSLPGQPAGFQCFTNVGPEVAIIIGGKSSESLAFSMNVSTMVWKQEAQLNAKRYRMACGVMRLGEKSGDKMVIAAGGTSDANKILSTVETLLVSENDAQFAGQWEFGPSLPMAISDGASTTASDQMELFIFGGTTSNSASSSDLIFKLSCSPNGDCSWTKIATELRGPSSMGLVLRMPSTAMGLRKYNNSRDCGIGKSLFELWLIKVNQLLYLSRF